MKRIGFVLLFLTASAFTFPAKEVKLEYVFKVGDEYTLNQTTNQTIKQSIMGMDQVAENLIVGQMKYKVASVTDTGAKLEMRFLKLKSSLKSVMGEKAMDTEGDSESTENKVLKSMMNKIVLISISKQGIVEVENSDNLWTGMDDLGLDEATLAQMKIVMEQMMGKKSLKNSLEQAMVYYSDKKVKQGDTWFSKNAFPMDFPIESNNTWSLANLAGDAAKVNNDATFATLDKNKTVNMPGGIQAKMDLAGNQATKADVNAKTGWPTEIHITSTLKGKMTLLAGGMIPTDMDVPMEILTQITYTIVKK